MKNKIVDSHCHLNFQDFKSDLDETIFKAKENGVEYMLSISVDLENFDDIYKITESFNNVWCTTGVHPSYVPKEFKNNEIQDLYNKLKKNLNYKNVIGLGETGLDFFRGKENKKNQVEYFKTHIKLAGEKKIPLIIHTRAADTETIENLNIYAKSYQAKGLIHCFSSGKELAKFALDIGFYISFSGIITFNKSNELRDIVKYVPIDRILVETDSPYLAPVPFRGGRNEPAFTKFTLEQVASIKRISSEKASEITTKNFFQLFTKAQREI